MKVKTCHSQRRLRFAHRLHVPSYWKPQGVRIVVGTVARAPLLEGELPHLHLPDTKTRRIADGQNLVVN